MLLPTCKQQVDSAAYPAGNFRKVLTGPYIYSGAVRSKRRTIIHGFGIVADGHLIPELSMTSLTSGLLPRSRQVLHVKYIK